MQTLWQSRVGTKGRLLMRRDCRLTNRWPPDREITGGETCSHSWRLPKRTLWARRPRQRLSRPKALSSSSSSSSSFPYDCSLCALYCSLSSGVLQSSQEGEERVGGGRLIPVPEVRRLCCSFPSPPLFLFRSLSFVRPDKKSGGSGEEAVPHFPLPWFMFLF